MGSKKNVFIIWQVPDKLHVVKAISKCNLENSITAAAAGRLLCGKPKERSGNKMVCKNSDPVMSAVNHILSPFPK